MTTPPPEITEVERELAEPDPPVPYGVVWRLLRDREHLLRESRDATRAAARTVVTLADDVGLALHQLREHVRGDGAGSELLVGIAARLDAAVARAGAHVVDPVGRRYDEVADVVDIVFAAPDVAADRLMVVRTVTAGLRMADGELVRRAQVELGAGE